MADITPEMARAELARRKAAKSGITPEMARAELERRRKPSGIGNVAAQGLIEGAQAIPAILEIAAQKGNPYKATIDAIDTFAGTEGDIPTRLNAVKESMQSLDMPITDAIDQGARKKLANFGVVPRQAEDGNFAENLTQIGSSMAVPTGVVYGLATKLPKLIPKTVQNVFKNPGKLAAGEAAGVTGAAAARTGAEILMEDSPQEEREIVAAIAEMFGMPTLQLALKGSMGLASAGKQVAGSMTEGGIEGRAANLLQVDMTPEEIDMALANLDVPVDAPITPARRTQNPKLMGLERDLNVGNRQLFLENETKVNQHIDKVISDALNPGKGESSDLTRFLQAEANAVKGKAASDAQNIAQTSNRVEASMEQRKRIDAAYEGLRSEVDELWGKVDGNVEIQDLPETKRAVSALKQEFKNNEDFAPDIIYRADRIINGRGESEILDVAGEAIEKLPTVEQMQNLRRDLLAEIRQLRSQPNTANTRRLLNDLQSAVLDDMDNVAEVSEELAQARQASFILNDKFNRGTIGKLRGYDADGSFSVDPGKTLSNILTSGKEEGAVRLRDLLRADNSPDTIQAAENYIGGIFHQAAVKDGVVDPNLGKKFLDDRREMLEQLPGLKGKIEKAIKSGQQFVDEFEDSLTGRKLRAATFLEVEDPKKAFGKTLNGDNPTNDLHQLVKKAKTDKSGKALIGLQNSAFEHIMDSIKNIRKTGGDILDGSAVSETSRAKINKVLGPDQIKAMQKSGLIDGKQAEALRRIRKELDLHFQFTDRSIPGSPNTAHDLLGNLASMVALRTVAPAVSKGAGPGSLSISARIGKISQEFANNLGASKVQELIQTALFEDPELLKTLMTKAKSEQQMKNILSTATEQFKRNSLQLGRLSAPMRTEEED